jgi:hypothetical protein
MKDLSDIAPVHAALALALMAAISVNGMLLCSFL